MAETTFKGVQFSPTQRFNLSYVLSEYQKVESGEFVDEDGNIIIKKKKSENEYWWNVQGAYSHPFKWIPEIQQLIRDATNKFEERLNDKKTFQVIFNSKIQLSKEPVSQVSGGGQYFVKANCYCLTLEGAVWRVVENLIKVQIQTTINVEEYLALTKEAVKLFDSVEISPTIKKVVKESEEDADNS